MTPHEHTTDTLVEIPSMLLPRTEAIRLTQILSETQAAMRTEAETTVALKVALRSVFMEAMRHFHEVLGPKEAMPDQIRNALHRLHEGSHGTPDYADLIGDLCLVQVSTAGADGDVARAIGEAEQALFSVRIG